MNTEHLRYFSLVYETLSYSAAANRIPMSVPGLMKAIDKLENIYGVAFFKQGDRGKLTPTKYADELYRFAVKFHDANIKLSNTIDQLCAQEKSEIRFGVCRGIIGLLGPEFFSDFEKKYPDTSLVYHELYDLDCDKSIHEHTCDVALTLAPYDEGLVTIPLYHDTIEFWIHEENPLYGKDMLSVLDFEGQSFAIPGRGHKCFSTMLSLFELQEVSPASIFETDEIFRTFEYSLNNKGLGYTNGHLKILSAFDRMDVLSCAPLHNVLWSFGFSYLPTHTLTNPEQSLLDYCFEYAAKLPRASGL